MFPHIIALMDQNGTGSQRARVTITRQQHNPETTRPGTVLPNTQAHKRLGPSELGLHHPTNRKGEVEKSVWSSRGLESALASYRGAVGEATRAVGQGLREACCQKGYGACKLPDGKDVFPCSGPPLSRLRLLQNLRRLLSS